MNMIFRKLFTITALFVGWFSSSLLFAQTSSDVTIPWRCGNEVATCARSYTFEETTDESYSNSPSLGESQRCGNQIATCSNGRLEIENDPNYPWHNSNSNACVSDAGVRGVCISSSVCLDYGQSERGHCRGTGICCLPTNSSEHIDHDEQAWSCGEQIVICSSSYTLERVNPENLVSDFEILPNINGSHECGEETYTCDSTLTLSNDPSQAPSNAEIGGSYAETSEQNNGLENNEESNELADSSDEEDKAFLHTFLISLVLIVSLFTLIFSLMLFFRVEKASKSGIGNTSKSGIGNASKSGIGNASEVGDVVENTKISKYKQAFSESSDQMQSNSSLTHSSDQRRDNEEKTQQHQVSEIKPTTVKSDPNIQDQLNDLKLLLTDPNERLLLNIQDWFNFLNKKIMTLEQNFKVPKREVIVQLNSINKKITNLGNSLQSESDNKSQEVQHFRREMETTLRDSKTKLQNAELGLKQTKTRLQNVESGLEQTNTKLQNAKLELEQTKKALNETQKTLQIAIQTTQQNYSNLKNAWFQLVENLRQVLLTDPLYQKNFTPKMLGMLNMKKLSEEIKRVFKMYPIDLDPKIAPSLKLLRYNEAMYARLPEELWRAASQLINAHYITIDYSRLEDLRDELAQLNPYEKENDLSVILSDPDLKNPNEYEKPPWGFDPFTKYVVGIVLRAPYVSANHSAPVMFIG